MRREQESGEKHRHGGLYYYFDLVVQASPPVVESP